MKRIFNQYRSVLYIAFMFIVLIGLIALAAENLNKTLSDFKTTQSDVEKLQNKMAILEANKSLTQSQIDDYNKLLTQLIPNQEDYFSILFALEQISQQTGFLITQYTISLSASSPGKLSVIVDGDGDSDAFFRFLQNYRYGGGRLITNDNIQYTANKVGQIRLSLNFYSRPVDTGTGNLVELSPKQINLMREIQQKTAIIIKDESTTSDNYPTKSNPF